MANTPNRKIFSAGTARLAICLLFSGLMHGVMLSLVGEREQSAEGQTQATSPLTATLQVPLGHTRKPVLKREATTPQRSAAPPPIAPGLVSSAQAIPLPAEPLAKTDPILISAEEIKIDQLPEISGDGYVDVELLISPMGGVVKIYLIETDLPEEYPEAVKRAFETARFVPGTRGNTAIYAKFRLRTVFGTAREKQSAMNADSVAR